MHSFSGATVAKRYSSDKGKVLFLEKARRRTAGQEEMTTGPQQ